MAGAGYKLFNTGDVLTAAQVNTYLMEQTVMVFANAAARTTALSGVVSEGMISYLKDTNAVEVYDGSNWVSSDDPNAIQNTIVDAKGDLIAASAADTPARLAVGNNGETLVADSSTSTGLRWQGNFAAGKNKIINGDFNIWQRGTSFSNPASGTYTADRFLQGFDGTGATRTISRQTFTPGTAPVAGYEGNYFYRYAFTAVGTSNTFNTIIIQRIENVTTFAGQTVTFSFWAKADANRTFTVRAVQDFGSGGSAATITDGSVSITTSWTRHSITLAIPSISGKTIGTSSFIEFFIFEAAGTRQTYTIDLWGVQVEAGSVATAFQTATGTLAGELAACQRYYWRFGGDSLYQIFGFGVASTTTNANIGIQFPVPMRVAPTSVDFATLGVGDTIAISSAVSAIAIGNNSKFAALLNVASSSMTARHNYWLRTDNSTAGYLGFNAEL